MNFEEFLELKKLQKGVLYAGPARANVVRRGHVAAPRGLPRTHVGVYVAWRIDQAKSFGPTGIVGLGKWIGGAY